MISKELEREFFYYLFSTNPNDKESAKHKEIEAILKDLNE